MTYREEVTITIGCTAPDEMFPDSGEWDDIPPEIQDEIPDGGLPCDGGGVPGVWCLRCKYGQVDDEEY